MGLKEVFNDMPVYMRGVISVVVLAVLGLIFYGAIANVGQSGNIAIPSAVNTTISTVTTNTGTAITTFLTVLITVVSLVIVFVLMKLFSGWIGGGSKGGDF